MLTIGGKCNETTQNLLWSECIHVRCLDANQLLYLKSQTTFSMCEYPCVSLPPFLSIHKDTNIKNLIKQKSIYSNISSY